MSNNDGWFYIILANGTMEFNHELFPEWTVSDYAKEFISVVTEVSAKQGIKL